MQAQSGMNFMTVIGTDVSLVTRTEQNRTEEHTRLYGRERESMYLLTQLFGGA